MSEFVSLRWKENGKTNKREKTRPRNSKDLILSDIVIVVVGVVIVVVVVSVAVVDGSKTELNKQKQIGLPISTDLQHFCLLKK